MILHSKLKIAVNHDLPRSPYSIGYVSGDGGWTDNAAHVRSKWRLVVLWTTIKDYGFLSFGGSGTRRQLFIGTENKWTIQRHEKSQFQLNWRINIRLYYFHDLRDWINTIKQQKSVLLPLNWVKWISVFANKNNVFTLWCLCQPN